MAYDAGRALLRRLTAVAPEVRLVLAEWMRGDIETIAAEVFAEDLPALLSALGREARP